MTDVWIAGGDHMALRVGVIGTGKIGQDHIRRMTHVVSGATVVAVTDIDTAKARAIAETVGARFEASGQRLIEAGDVDAIAMTSRLGAGRVYAQDEPRLGAAGRRSPEDREDRLDRVEADTRALRPR